MTTEQIVRRAVVDWVSRLPAAAQSVITAQSIEALVADIISKRGKSN